MIYVRYDLALSAHSESVNRLDMTLAGSVSVPFNALRRVASHPHPTDTFS